MNIYIRTMGLPVLTGALVPVLLAASRASTIQTDLTLGVLMPAGILTGHFPGRVDS